MRIIIIEKRRAAAFIYALAIAVAVFACFEAYNTWGYHRWFPAVSDYEIPSGEAFAPKKEGYSVLIDLDSLRLTLYMDGEQLKSWPVSGGKTSTPSPTGQWRVSGIGTWGEGFGGSWIALNVPWGTYGIHGTVEPWVVGTRNASHGCFRMKNADAKELRKHMSVGVPVYIKQDSAPVRTLKEGMAGSDVLSAQRMLYALGYLNGSGDGMYGYATRQAVKSFQKDRKLKQTGTIGNDTLTQLKQLTQNLSE